MMKPFVHPEAYVKRRIQEVGIENDGVLCYSKAYHDAMFANLLTMLRMIDLPKGMSVLDVGAGKFDLYKFLLENGYTVGSYTGVDYSPELVEYGMNRFPGTRGFVGDFLDMDDKARYDLVVSTGAMPYCVVGADDPEARHFAIIDRMFSMCNLATVFDAFSTRKPTDADENSFVADVVKTTFHCINLTNGFVVRHVPDKTGYFGVVLLRLV